MDQHPGLRGEQELVHGAADQGGHDEQQDQGSGQALRILSEVLPPR